MANYPHVAPQVSVVLSFRVIFRIDHAEDAVKNTNISIAITYEFS